MAAIADLSDLVNRATGGNSGSPENIWFSKQSRIAGSAAPAGIAGRWQSLWRHDGFPAGGAAPTTVAVPVNTTVGGLLQADPGGGRSKWLTSFAAWGLASGVLMLYDRLLHIGSLDATVTTAQTVAGTLTRYTNGVGNMAFIEVYTQIGASGTTVVMNYNSTQVSPTVTIGGTGFREQCRAIMLPVNGTDNTIQAVDSIDLTATTSTAGNIGVTVGHPLAVATIGNAGFGGWRDFTTGLPGIPEIKTDACLALLWMPATTDTPDIMGCVSSVEA